MGRPNGLHRDQLVADRQLQSLFIGFHWFAGALDTSRLNLDAIALGILAAILTACESYAIMNRQVMSLVRQEGALGMLWRFRKSVFCDGLDRLRL